MLPFEQYHHYDDSLSIGYYVAKVRGSFSIHMKLTGSGRERTWYGARVYVYSGNDSGKAGMDDTYTKWSDKISDETVGSERADTSNTDQYFFINAGSTEHIIEGFYLTPQKSRQFVFAEPAIRETSNGHCCAYHELDCIGMIYIVFCRVE